MGKLDFGGGFRVKEVAEVAPVAVAVAEVASLLAACTAFLEEDMEGEGGNEGFASCEYWNVKDSLISVSEERLQGGKKGRKTDENWKKAFLAVCSGILARGPTTDLSVVPLTPDFSYKAVDTPKTLVLFPTLTRLFIFFFCQFFMAHSQT